MNQRLSLRALRDVVTAGPPYEEAFLALLAGDPRAGARVLLDSCRRRQERVATEEARLVAMMAHEEAAHRGGFTRIAGVDEAGRGPLAGPIVAAAVVLAAPVAGIDDSKRLTPEQRERLFAALHKGGHAIGVAMVSPEDIDHWGIQSANYSAMARAVDRLEPPPDFLLVDGFAIPGAPIPQERLIKGDRRSLSIAAASIIAKVVRDRTMRELDRRYPEYGFGKHKGYGTAEHLAAVRRYGACPAHRKSFAPIAGAPETAQLFTDNVEDIA
jgi:ribonuclease HII